MKAHLRSPSVPSLVRPSTFAPCPMSDVHCPHACPAPSVELQKANLEGGAGGTGAGAGTASGGGSASPLASAIPLAQLLTKSSALGALTSLSALGGLTDLLSGSNSNPPVQTTGVHRNHKSYNQRRQDDDTTTKSTKERNKFSPY